MLKTMVAFATIAFITAALAHTAGPEAEEVQIEQYGSVAASSGAETPTFVVIIGRPRFATDRRALAAIVGIYEANAIQCVRRRDGTWTTLEYRLPLTAIDFAVLRAHGADGIAVRRIVRPQDLPSQFDRLPSELLANVSSFLHFYSGALRIYLTDQSEPAARRLAEAITSGHGPRR